MSYTKIHPVYYPNNILRKKIKKPFTAKFFNKIIFKNNIFILITLQLYNRCNIFNTSNTSNISNTCNTCNIYNFTKII